MEDKILIEDLLLRCIIGANDDERRDKQDVLINLAMYADVFRPGETDNIDDAINYRTIAKRVIQHVESSKFFLVEALATSIARIILAEFPVKRVNVKVQKIGAVRFSKTVGVEIERNKSHFVV
ncbi:MAG: dihydroneopterin aldolase [Thermodesulfobacteriota bacterium]